MKKKTSISFLTLLLAVIITVFISCSEDSPTTQEEQEETTGTFTDSRDNQTYDWIKIGDQVWMAENLSYKPSSGNFWAINNIENNVPILGYLYSWEIAQSISPNGWHLPSQAEWQILVNQLGGTDQAYDKLLESVTNHWRNPNSATNESGFTALPTGYFDQRDNSFNGTEFLTMFHSSTEYSGNSESAMGLLLNQNFHEANIEGRPKLLALPVRCIKD